MIIIAGIMRTRPELVEDLAATLNSMVEGTMKEDGCLAYHFAIQSREEGTVLAYERWRDEESLAAHLAQPHIGAVLGDWGDKIELEVSKFDASNERGMMG